MYVEFKHTDICGVVQALQSTPVARHRYTRNRDTDIRGVKILRLLSVQFCTAPRISVLFFIALGRKKKGGHDLKIFSRGNYFSTFLPLRGYVSTFYTQPQPISFSKVRV